MSKPGSMKYGKFIKKKDCKFEMCIICLSSLQGKPDAEMKKKYAGIVWRTGCNHEFHTICLCKWIEAQGSSDKLSCPICRDKIDANCDGNKIWAFTHDCIFGVDYILCSEYGGV